ncbi:MAG: CHAP domain-containing protein [Clostridia bacterium]|nr:CHAP domain-containing protein [Clostridia bacterium]
MKKFLKLLTLALSLCLLVSTFSIPTDAVTYATYRACQNSAHSSYVSSIYYKNYHRVPLTGDQRTDVVALALSQTGYKESSSLSNLGGVTSGGYGNYTEYNYNMGRWMNGDSGYSYDWCATFCSWALYQARCTNQTSLNDWCRNHYYDTDYIWREVGCPTWAQQLRYCGYFKYSAHNGGSYKPQPGDLIFYDWDGGSSGEDHIGIVVYSDNSKVYTIEGNTSDAAGLEANGGGVYFKSYSLNYGYISGYGVLPYKTNSSVPAIDYSGNNPTPGLYIAAGGSKSVYSTATATSASYTLPRFSLVDVTEIASNGRLKATCTINGSTVVGYIENNSTRIVQISTSQVDGLNEALTAAESIYIGDYSEDVLSQIRTAYTNGKALLNSSSSTHEQRKAAAETLNNLIAKSGQGTLVSDGVYITAYNTKIVTSNCNIFTPSFGTITATNANHKWTTNVLAKFDTSKNAYVIKSITPAQGANTPDVTLASDEILIVMHQDTTNSACNSNKNAAVLANAKVGDILTFYGADPSKTTMSCAAYFTFETGFVPGDASGDDLISTADCLIVETFISSGVASDEVLLRADIDGDGIVSSTDLLAISKICNGQ